MNDEIKGLVAWREIPGWPYEASDAGQVRNARTGRVLRPSVSNGYERICLHSGGRHQMFVVHRLVHLAWIGAIPSGLTVNHTDGNKRNNTPANLEAMTVGDNVRHAVALGLAPFGARNGTHTRPDRVARGSKINKARLTDEDVRAIRLSLATGATDPQIAAMYGIDRSAIRAIRNGKTWTHVE